jgi:deoxyribodipyrimidine photo-lyase
VTTLAPTLPITFEPTLQAAHARLAAVHPDVYARTRNALSGAVTRLSPYLTHGILSLREVYDSVHARHPLDLQHKFVFELGWRAYWHHVWDHVGDGVHASLRRGLMPEDAYQTEMPADIVEARTGVPAIDLAVRELYATGYVHNHARMWLASYMVHLRKVHWHAGAQWMLGHLLDGDVASNHLSWQWVAATGSSKPYLFNADNVAKYAPAAWHSFGSVIDTRYEALDKIARSSARLQDPRAAAAAGEGMPAPSLHASPLQIVAGWSAPDAAIAKGRDIWLVHPWCLCALPDPNLPGETAHIDTLVIAAGFVESHRDTPWSARRWQFVTQGLQAHTPHLWWCAAADIAEALREVRSVTWHPDPHVDVALFEVQAQLKQGTQSPTCKTLSRPALFEPVSKHCASFSEWWRRTRLVT